MSRAYIVFGMGYGDEGKGSIVDALTRKLGAKFVVRYSGGPQAAHNVVSNDGVCHTFSQFGSGTLAGAATYLSDEMFIEPLALMREAAHLRSIGISSPESKLFINPSCKIITPYHILSNRISEITKGNDSHGSCGMGHGDATRDWLNLGIGSYVEHLRLKQFDFLKDVRHRKLIESEDYISRAIRNRGVKFDGYDKAIELLNLIKSEETLNKTIEKYRIFVSQYNQCFVGNEFLVSFFEKGPLILEGSQGILLDGRYGFAPYNTYADITPRRGQLLLNSIGYPYSITNLGVIRSYMTRHGKGPFVTEDFGLGTRLNDGEHNTFNEWQKNFRVGYLDLVAIKYAMTTAACHALVINHLDKLQKNNPICVDYNFTGNDVIKNNYLHVKNKRLIYQRGESQQVGLTNFIQECFPKYKMIPKENFIPFVSEALGYKEPWIFGYGPMAKDKKIARQIA